MGDQRMRRCIHKGQIRLMIPSKGCGNADDEEICRLRRGRYPEGTGTRRRRNQNMEVRLYDMDFSALERFDDLRVNVDAKDRQAASCNEAGQWEPNVS